MSSTASCTTTSSGPCRRSPSLPAATLTLTALSGGITNRNFRVDAAGTEERWVIRLAGNDTHLLGISREVEHAATVAAAGVGVGPEVTAFIRPEGYLVTRFIVGTPVTDEAVHRPETLRRVADSLRRIHDGPAIPGLFVPLRIADAYRALALARGVPIPAEYDLAAGIGRRIERAHAGEPDRAAAVPQRPAQRELHRRRRADPDHRLGIRGDGRPVLRPRQLQHQPRADAGRGRDPAGRLRRRRPGRPARPADTHACRVRLPRGDVGRPSAGRQHARRRLRGVRRDELRPAAPRTPPNRASNAPSTRSPGGSVGSPADASTRRARTRSAAA